MVEPRRAERIAIVRNPRSGSAPDAAALEQSLRNSGIAAEIHDAPEGLSPWVDRIADRYDIIVAAGGDGTVSAVAAAVARAGKTLAILPTGTLNHFARDLGVPTDMDQAIAVLGTGRQRGVDLGVVNQRLFLNNVSLGNYPRMVYKRTQLERDGRSRPVAAAIAVSRTWWHLRKLTAFFNIDGRELVRRSPFIIVGNGSYVLSGLALGKRDEINDGRLSLYVAPPTGRLGVLALPFRALAGTLERHEQFETFCADRITAMFPKRLVEAGIDGEVQVLESPLEFSIRKRALKVLVPFDCAQGKP